MRGWRHEQTDRRPGRTKNAPAGQGQGAGQYGHRKTATAILPDSPAICTSAWWREMSEHSAPAARIHRPGDKPNPALADWPASAPVAAPGNGVANGHAAGVEITVEAVEPRAAATCEQRKTLQGCKSFDDIGNAERLMVACSEDIRYVY